MSEKMTSQQWVEHVYGVLALAARCEKRDEQRVADCELCLSVVEAIASGEIKGWTTAQKICSLIAKARKA